MAIADQPELGSAPVRSHTIKPVRLLILLIALAGACPSDDVLIAVDGQRSPRQCADSVRRAKELLEQQKIRDAQELILTSEKVCPGDAQLHDALGLSYDFQDRFTQAQKAYREAIALDPEIAGFHDHLGVSYFRSGNPAGGLREFQRALELDPRDKVAHINLATYCLQRKEYRQAASHFRKAQIDRSNDAVLLLELA